MPGVVSNLLASKQSTYKFAANGVLGNWRARSIDCRGQPLLGKPYNLHHCQMDSAPATRAKTILAEGPQLVPRTLVITAALAVLAHTIVMLVHGAAHMRLNI